MNPYSLSAEKIEGSDVAFDEIYANLPKTGHLQV